MINFIGKYVLAAIIGFIFLAIAGAYYVVSVATYAFSFFLLNLILGIIFSIFRGGIFRKPSIVFEMAGAAFELTMLMMTFFVIFVPLAILALNFSYAFLTVIVPNQAAYMTQIGATQTYDGLLRAFKVYEFGWAVGKVVSAIIMFVLGWGAVSWLENAASKNRMFFGSMWILAEGR